MGPSRDASASRFHSRRLARWLFYCLAGYGAATQRPSLAAAAEDAASATEPAVRPVVTLAYDTASTSPLLLHAVTRLRAELNAAGFTGVLREPWNVSGGGRASAYARVSLEVTDESLRLDIVSSSSATSSHAILLGTEREVEGLMLQATEFLRAGIVPRLAPRAAVSVERAPLLPAQRQAPGRRWAVDAGATLATSWGAADVLPLLSFAAGYYPAARLSVGGSFDIPLASGRYPARLGSATYRILFGSLEAEYVVVGSAPAALALGLSVGAAHTVSWGEPLLPLEPRNASLWSLSLGVGVRAELRLWRFLALTTRLRAISLSPTPLVAVVDDERRLGSPCLLFSFGGRVVADGR